ncbi:hypothetical protein [Streptacidiphilus melanogenes]|uniref:hypothetical protein n=1 Tax=Streptacidiphilus melanogenes TaxID=411235 RepID=UPI00126A226D|nr:hypothetical protein [Streptacidiphilus melanogenes]
MLRTVCRLLGYLLILVGLPAVVQAGYLLSCQMGHDYNAWEFTASGATAFCFAVVLAVRAMLRDRRQRR